MSCHHNGLTLHLQRLQLSSTLSPFPNHFPLYLQQLLSGHFESLGLKIFVYQLLVTNIAAAAVVAVAAVSGTISDIFGPLGLKMFVK